jgi:hypothetical protein
MSMLVARRATRSQISPQSPRRRIDRHHTPATADDTSGRDGQRLNLQCLQPGPEAPILAQQTFLEQ